MATQAGTQPNSSQAPVPGGTALGDNYGEYPYIHLVQDRAVDSMSQNAAGAMLTSLETLATPQVVSSTRLEPHRGRLASLFTASV